MWKRNDYDEEVTDSGEKKTPPKPKAETPLSPPKSSKSSSSNEIATIGSSISIRGDISGNEDLLVRGNIEGTIDLKKHNVHIGDNGSIKANVHAQIITVEGRVSGDLTGIDQIIVRGSGNVEGNITAPRVVLEDGCRFKGAIDMDGSAIGAKKDAGSYDSQSGANASKVSSIGDKGKPADSSTSSSAGFSDKK